MTRRANIFAFVTAVAIGTITSVAFHLNLWQTFAVSVVVGFFVISIVNIYMEV
jgi:hypothetical protein